MEFRYAWIADLDIFGVYPAPSIQDSNLPTTIDAPWRRRLRESRWLWQRRLPKPRWAPSVLSQAWGTLFVQRKLGLTGTLICWRNRLARLQRFGTLRLKPQSPTR
jgi:hypothetical protein